MEERKVKTEMLVESGRPDVWEVLTEQEKSEYKEQIKRVETTYFDEFDTCRERLDMLVYAINDFYYIIGESRIIDRKREEEKKNASIENGSH